MLVDINDTTLIHNPLPNATEILMITPDMLSSTEFSRHILKSFSTSTFSFGNRRVFDAKQVTSSRFSKIKECRRIMNYDSSEGRLEEEQGWTFKAVLSLVNGEPVIIQYYLSSVDYNEQQAVKISELIYDNITSRVFSTLGNIRSNYTRLLDQLGRDIRNEDRETASQVRFDMARAQMQAQYAAFNQNRPGYRSLQDPLDEIREGVSEAVNDQEVFRQLMRSIAGVDRPSEQPTEVEEEAISFDPFDNELEDTL